MKELEKYFKKGKKTYTQIGKNDSAYLYEVIDATNDQTSAYYEVFYKREAKAVTLPNGGKLPQRIRYPNTNDFGKWAWCMSRGSDFATALRIATYRFNFMDEYAKEKAA